MEGIELRLKSARLLDVFHWFVEQCFGKTFCKPSVAVPGFISIRHHYDQEYWYNFSSGQRMAPATLGVAL